MEDKIPYPLNLHCKKASFSGNKVSDRWMVYFYYIEKGQRKQYRSFKGLNEPNQSLANKKRKAHELLIELDNKLNTSIFDVKTKEFIPTTTDASLMRDLLDEYLAYKKENISSATYANYYSVFKAFKKFIGKARLIDVTKDTMKTYFRSIDVKPQTKRTHKIYISSFFNWAIEVKELPITNITHNIRLENNHPVEKHKVYSKSEMKDIIDYCDSNNDFIMKTIIYLVYGAQVRISEILRMQIADFKLEENKIVLPKGKGKIKNKIKTVLLDEPLKQYLLKLPIDYSSSKDTDKFFIGVKKRYAKASFCQKLPLSKNTVDTRFKHLKKDLNIGEHKTLYSFKHTGNVNLLLNGADIIELMYKNGHTKISQTETYARQLIEQVPEMKYIRKKRDDLEFR